VAEGRVRGTNNNHRVFTGAAYMVALRGVSVPVPGNPTMFIHRTGLLLGGTLVARPTSGPPAALVSIVWAVLAIRRHNRKAAARDAASRAVWNAEMRKILGYG
jgi:hypothetical protein